MGTFGALVKRLREGVSVLGTSSPVSRLRHDLAWEEAIDDFLQVAGGHRRAYGMRNEFYLNSNPV
jgi:hypothetical protein